ncbi:MAG TPA: hypothetical protein VJ725_22775 [Thermoanaerobaculia bacterium]|nr:hypothetical protein [Thermoanaerobaculia bacterium]
MRAAALLALLLLAAACGPAETPRAPGAAPNVFDPRAIAPGQEFLGLVVVEAEAAPAADRPVYVGRVLFRGEITVAGTFRPHPEDGPQVPCFTVDAATAGALPRFPGDERVPWFCFRNTFQASQAMREAAGSPKTIVIRGFETAYRLTDAIDEAEFVRLLP